MTSLGCFKDRQRLIEALLNSKHNTEKVIYFLLLDRKMRQPSHEDAEETKQRSRSGSPDVPQKRVDRHRSNGVGQSPNCNSYRPGLVGQLAEGSPLVPRRQFYSNMNNKTISANNTPSVSPCSSPTITKKDVFAKIATFAAGKASPDVAPAPPAIPPPPSQHIHRHHRNTSTVSQNENVLTTQPSRQSMGISSDQSYSSVNTESLINNGTDTTFHPARRNPAPPPPPATHTSDSMSLESSPSIVSNESSSPLSSSSNQMQAPQTPNNNQWRHKLNNLKQSFQSVGTPRFHRRPKVLRKHHAILLCQQQRTICSSQRKRSYEHHNNIQLSIAVRDDARGDQEIALSSHHRRHARRSSYDRGERSAIGSDQDRSHSRLSLGKCQHLTSHSPSPPCLTTRHPIWSTTFSPVPNIDANIVGQIVRRCSNATYVSTSRYVQSNLSRPHRPRATTSHSR